MGNGSIKLSLEELACELEMQYLEKGLEFCKVKEDFNKSDECTYVVDHLVMDISGDLCSCSDEKEIILSRESVLMLFAKTCLVSIYKVFKQGKCYDVLNFIDGKVIIEAF